MKKFMKREKSFLKLSAGMMMLAGSTFGASFTDEHNDGLLTDWQQSGRVWMESGGFVSPASASNAAGFLIRNTAPSANGTLNVTIKADQWNGQNGGVVFRYLSSSQYYYVAVRPGVQSDNWVKLFKGTTNVNSAGAITIAQNFSMGTTFNLKIVMNGSKFDFYIDNVLRRTLTDNTYASGKIGYAYTNDYNDYIDFDRIQWTESESLPGAPSNLQGSIDASSGPRLTWTDNSTNENGFSIERSVNNGTFSEITKVAANVTSYQDNTAQPNNSYSYRVKAYNSAGSSGCSSAVTIETIPSAVSNLSAAAPAEFQINLAWNDNSGYEKGFSIERALNDGAFREVYRSGPNITSYVDKRLQDGTTYRYRIRAFNGTGYSPYSAIASATTQISPVRLLIIVNSQLYRQGVIASDLAQYQEDILVNGWKSQIVTVSRTQDGYADLYCPDVITLKNHIKSYYPYGLKGFVIIGSANEVPTAYWRFHEKEPATNKDPTDLFYADTGTWVDLGNDGVYETLHSKLDKGNWVEDTDNPANPNNPKMLPEMFYARICADTLVSQQDEAAFVSKYLYKVHKYRATGSNLTRDQFKRSLFLVNDCYSGSAKSQLDIQSSTPDINVLAGYTLVSPEGMQLELSKGFKCAQIISHSSNLSHTNGFSLEDLKACTPRVHNVNLFACSAGKFSEPNFGETYIFYNDYTLSVTASTGGWGTWMDSVYYRKISEGKSVGEAWLDWLVRRADYGAPKGMLFGDPLISYAALPVDNKPPMFRDVLFSHEATAGLPFSMYFEAVDPEGDPVYITIQDLPAGARFDGSTLTWTPDIGLAGTRDTLTAIVMDSKNNKTTQPFTIYVSDFRNGTLVDNTGWTISGNVNIDASVSDPYYTPQGVKCHPIKTDNSNGRLQQSISVKPNNKYRLEFGALNKLTSANKQAFLRIEELNLNYPVSAASGPEFQNFDKYFKTYDQTSLTISLCNGDQSTPTTGNVFFTALKLVDLGPVPTNLQNGDFEESLEYWDGTILEGRPFIINDVLGQDGFCAWIWNFDEAGAGTLTQEVIGLRPWATYKVSGWIQCEDVPQGSIGAYLGLADNSVRSQSVTGTVPKSWEKVEFTFTAPSNGMVTIAATLGAAGNPVIGGARFDNITMELIQ